MKREDIAKIFEGATEEQINAVLDKHYKGLSFRLTYRLEGSGGFEGFSNSLH